jgi:hypothetical protein
LFVTMPMTMIFDDIVGTTPAMDGEDARPLLSLPCAAAASAPGHRRIDCTRCERSGTSAERSTGLGADGGHRCIKFDA